MSTSNTNGQGPGRGPGRGRGRGRGHSPGRGRNASTSQRPVNPVSTNENVVDLRQQMEALKVTSKWPQTYRLKRFSSGLFADVRLTSAPGFCHEMVRQVDDRNTGKNCALCSNGNVKRTSMFWCQICEVHLCITPITPNATRTCKEQWHASTDLKKEAENRNKQVASLQVINREKKKQKSERGDSSAGEAKRTLEEAEVEAKRIEDEAADEARLAELHKADKVSAAAAKAKRILDKAEAEAKRTEEEAAGEARKAEEEEERTRKKKEIQVRTNESVVGLRKQVEALKVTGQWPQKCRLGKFSSGLFAKVRLTNAPGFCHEMIRHVDDKNFGKNCALCSNGNVKRTSMFWCQICEVHLCITPITPNSTKTCKEQWHALTDLKREAENRNRQIASLQVIRRGKKRRKSERGNSTDGTVNKEEAATEAKRIIEEEAAEVKRIEAVAAEEARLAEFHKAERAAAAAIAAAAEAERIIKEAKAVAKRIEEEAAEEARKAEEEEARTRKKEENVVGLREQMDLMKVKGGWPKRFRLSKFSSGLLAKVRLNDAPSFCHKMLRQVDDRNIGKNCALCSNGNVKRTSMFWCQICEVHLCTTPITTNSKKTCTEQWHALTHLKREAENRNRQVASLQVINRGKKRQKSEREDITDDMANKDEVAAEAKRIEEAKRILEEAEAEAKKIEEEAAEEARKAEEEAEAEAKRIEEEAAEEARKAEEEEERTRKKEEVQARTNESAVGLRQQMNLLKVTGKWPKTYRLAKFSSGVLAKVRLTSAPSFCHEMVRQVDDRNIGRNCALCSNGNVKRTSMFWCQICEVHLCTTPITTNSKKTCTEQWHALTDLKGEAENRNRQVASLQVINRGKKRQKIEREESTAAEILLSCVGR